ncbi:MAG: hypothetical protein KF760_12245 [Candidatus Eremiobacteraeota bacterium]|nr:hypothetical protein [Candidatus Eremiobacteraeota bacterium]
MQRSFWFGLMLIAVGTSAFADPQAKVRKINDQENSYTYYNWKPNRPKVQPAAAPATNPSTSAPSAGYTPIRPTPTLLNPASGYVDPTLGYPLPQPVVPPAYYGPGPQSYYSSPYFSSGFYNTGYAYPGLQVSNNGYFTGLSLNGVYRHGNFTIRAGNPGFYGPGFNGFRGGRFNGGAPGGFRGGFVPVR